MSEPTPAADCNAGRTADDDLIANLADEFLRRHRAGERPTADEYAQKHPEHAERIRSLFAAMIALEQPGVRAAFDSAAASERVGSTIGRYKLLERIGEGGFGVVFMAEQQHPVRRRVALKVIKPGFDSGQIIARFEVERQALALMEHENIARVLDAGATDSGRPYFVMELVRGVPITDFCDQNQFAPRQRLELFAQVCRAVQHAHTKGIIHRDIKPTNVLVTLHEGVAIPKVIDFGVAKATGQQLTDKTLFTNFAQMVGTPLYMSPEQAEMTSIDVDTRSDVYSLGVLLYELLTGTTPLDRERLKQAAFDEVRRIIREEEPPRPSTRLSTMGEQAQRSISAQRKSDPKQLRRLVRGELDWIVMKALEKERARRYETANSLARDIERYLHDEPVEACPPSTAYRVRKFVRRNKGPVLAATLVLITLVGGIVGTTVGLVRADRAAKAEARRAAAEKQAKETAEKRLAQIERGIDLIGGIFDDLDPLAEAKEGRPLRAILGDRLDRAVAELDGEAVGDPLVVARLQDRLGITYLGLGQPAKAEPLLAKALATRKALLGADHRLTLASAYHQAIAYHSAGKRNEAIARIEQVLDAHVRFFGPDDPATLSIITGLAHVYWQAGKVPDAIVLLEKVRDVRIRQLGEDDSITLNVLTRLGGAYLSAKRFPDAIAVSEKVLEAQVRKHGNDHAYTIDALNSLAYCYQGAGRMREALPLFERARDAAVATLGPDHTTTLVIRNNLAAIYRAFGRLPEAIALAEKVRDAQVTKLGARHPTTLLTVHNLALAYRADNKLDKALPLFEQAAAGAEELRFMHSDAYLFVANLCECHEHLQQYEQAEVWRRKWLAVLREKSGPQSANYAAELERLGVNLLRQDKHADAEQVLRECLAIFANTRADAPMATSSSAARVRMLLGTALLDQRKYAEAEPMLVQGYEGMSNAAQRPSNQHHGAPGTEAPVDGLKQLVRLYEEWGNPEQAARWRRELDARTKK